MSVPDLVIARLFRANGMTRDPETSGYTYTFNASEPPLMPDRLTVTPEVAELVGRNVLIDKVVSDLQFVRGPFKSAHELREQVVAALVGGGFREVTE